MPRVKEESRGFLQAWGGSPKRNLESQKLISSLLFSGDGSPMMLCAYADRNPRSVRTRSRYAFAWIVSDVFRVGLETGQSVILDFIFTRPGLNIYRKGPATK